MRTFKNSRKTSETSIEVAVNIDKYEADINTGIGFFDHMLALFAKHGKFGISLKAKGDYDVDFHHTVEDIGIMLGKAFYAATGDKVGIRRYGSAIIPMDETLVESVIDFGGRGYLVYNVSFPTEKIGNFDTELVEEFFRAFSSNAKCNLHINMRYGTNSHHIAEAIFKSFARALSISLAIESDNVMSTKGVLE